MISENDHRIWTKEELTQKYINSLLTQIDELAKHNRQLSAEYQQVSKERIRAEEERDKEYNLALDRAALWAELGGSNKIADTIRSNKRSF